MAERRLEVIDAGLVPYDDALAWQRRLAAERIAGQLDHDVLLLLQHPPVITVGRGGRAEHLVSPGDVRVVEVERGGDVTFHGPGQLVGYPILDLTHYRRDLHWYLRALERVLIEVLGSMGITAERREGYTGVWTRGRKIASIGVHVKQWVTWHGFALNVNTDLAHFARIVPCGIEGVEMTSVEREAGHADWDRTMAAVVQAFGEVFVLQDALHAEPGL